MALLHPSATFSYRPKRNQIKSNETRANAPRNGRIPPPKDGPHSCPHRFALVKPDNCASKVPLHLGPYPVASMPCVAGKGGFVDVDADANRGCGRANVIRKRERQRESLELTKL